MTEPGTDATRRPVRPFDTERLLRALERLQSQRAFTDAADLQAFLDAYRNRPLDEVRAAAGCTPAEDAQELAFQALEARSAPEARSLAQRALELDPTCVDARHAAVVAGGLAPEEAIGHLKVIAVEAEQALGASFIENQRGRLWGHLRARPYLRARLAVGALLEKAGKAKEALAHFEALLRFSQGDPQGVRYHAARCQAVLGRAKALATLLEAFPADDGATWTWLQVLARLQAGDEKGARGHLALAQSRNPHVHAFLTAERKLPREDFEAAAPGTVEEAVEAMRVLGPAWGADRDALSWLMRQKV